MTVRTRAFAAAAAMLAVTTLGAACSSDDAENSSTTEARTETTAAADESTTTTAEPRQLTILVSNDDGVAAPGIDALVAALAALPDTEVVVSAPADQQSGTGSKTTEGELVATETTTASGHPAMAVQGFPADSVNWALDGGIPETPQLVVTGINSGQNLGLLADQVSGTVGAARAAVAHGIPALATSMGHSDHADYALAATYVVAWVEEHRQALLDGELAGDVILLQNLNVPHCESGSIRGELEVTVSPSGDGAFQEQDCTSTLEAPTDDITAFNHGFVTLSDVPAVAPAA
ncbi:MAG: 5'/3'-nucleotidase SurE [Microthrixaceae bacterium]